MNAQAFLAYRSVSLQFGSLQFLDKLFRANEAGPNAV